LFLFFALDRQNYCRWISVHLKDMKSLTEEILLQFKENFTIRKTNNRFSNLPIDQVHEQQNAKLKVKGGIIGLTENPSLLQKWMVCGPETSRVVTGFEKHFLPQLKESHYHHEEGNHFK
jgi:hypothetical protein